MDYPEHSRSDGGWRDPVAAWMLYGACLLGLFLWSSTRSTVDFDPCELEIGDPLAACDPVLASMEPPATQQGR